MFTRDLAEAFGQISPIAQQATLFVLWLKPIKNLTLMHCGLAAEFARPHFGRLSLPGTTFLDSRSWNCGGGKKIQLKDNKV